MTNASQILITPINEISVIFNLLKFQNYGCKKNGKRRMKFHKNITVQMPFQNNFMDGYLCENLESKHSVLISST